MNVHEILSHPIVKAADPVVLVGGDRLTAQAVRWVHSSEVLDIGPLLRGGELLLSGGESLAKASSAKQEQYVRELAARNVAALAIETGAVLPEIPSEVVRAAVESKIILIELRSVVPFVVIAESINSTFVTASVAMLEKADELSHAVAVELAAGAGLREILSMIAAELSATVSLLVPGAFSQDLIDVSGSSREDAALLNTVEVEIPIRGIVAAALQIGIADPGQELFVQTVGERVADVLGLAMLQQRPPTLGDIAGVQLIRAVIARERETALQDLCASVGVNPARPLAMLFARSVEPNRLRGKLERSLICGESQFVLYAVPGELFGLVVLPANGKQQARADLVERLTQVVDVGDGSVCVGPLVDEVSSANHSLEQAKLALELAPGCSVRANVVDSDELVVDRLIAENSNVELRHRLTAELLGDLLQHDATRGTALVETLEIWLRSGCNTAQSARLLFLERQSMHNRLQRIFALIGGDPRGTGRLAGLAVALRALRQTPSNYHSA